MRREARLLLALAPLLLTGCITGRMNAMMESWVGHPSADLLMQWGPPQGVYDDGEGGRILVYTATRQWTTPGQATTTTTAQATAYNNMIWGQAQSYSQFTPPQTQGYTAWRMFRLDRNGRIVSWSWRGL